MPADFFERDCDVFFESLVRQNRVRTLEVPPENAFDLCSNDYLCLSQDRRILSALHEGIARYGAGSTASRLVRGHREVFDVLEQKIAAWLKTESALFFANGYAGNVGTLSAICDPSYAAFVDRLAHASLVDGIRLSGARKIYFHHNDTAHLESLLARCPQKKRIIVTETVFSMDGDRAPVAELWQLAQRYGALLYCDEAHAIGVLGNEGGGLATQKADFRLVTFGKALGLEGAAVATSAKAVKYLLHRARTFVFSTAPLPAVAYAAIAAIELARTMEKERNHIAAMAEKLRSTLRAAGWECGNSTTQIVPLMCRSEEEALRLSAALLSAGIHARAIRPPTVQKPRIRFSLHAAVTEQILERLVAALSAEALCL